MTANIPQRLVRLFLARQAPFLGLHRTRRAGRSAVRDREGNPELPLPRSGKKIVDFAVAKDERRARSNQTANRRGHDAVIRNLGRIPQAAIRRESHSPGISGIRNRAGDQRARQLVGSRRQVEDVVSRRSDGAPLERRPDYRGATTSATVQGKEGNRNHPQGRGRRRRVAGAKVAWIHRGRRRRRPATCRYENNERHGRSKKSKTHGGLLDDHQNPLLLRFLSRIGATSARSNG